MKTSVELSKTSATVNYNNILFSITQLENHRFYLNNSPLKYSS